MVEFQHTIEELERAGKLIGSSINVARPEPPPKRGGRSTTVLVVRDVIQRFLSDENVDLVKYVVDDFGARDDMGFEKHGQNLETNDGRFTEKDAYEELLDAAQYYKKQTLEEPENEHAKQMYDAVLMLVMKARLGLRDKQARIDATDWRKPSENKDSEDSAYDRTDDAKRDIKRVPE